MKLPDEIRERREARGWTKKRLAMEAGVSGATITRLERGDYGGQFDTVTKVAAALGIETGTLREMWNEAEETKEGQYNLDLSRVSPSQRRKLKRTIDALVREWEREEEEENGGV